MASDKETIAEEALDAANTAAGRTRTSWLAHISLGAYLFVIVGETSHRDLLLESPLTLPILGVELPIQGFYVVAPLLFLLMHLNLLLQMRLFRAKLQAFHTALGQVADDTARHLRRRMDLFVYAQLLGGAGSGANVRYLMRAMVACTTVAGPVVLVLAMQLAFLPYQHEGITWWQRVMVLTEITLLAGLWPRVPEEERAAQRSRGARWVHRAVVAGWGLGAAGVLVMSLLLATFPGEHMHRWYPAGHPRLAALKTALFEGEPDLLHGVLSSPFARVLAVPDFAPAAGQGPPVLRGRSLRNAVLVRARLSDADLTGAQLQNAQLQRARLDGARLGCADSRRQREAAARRAGGDVDDGCADLTGANLQRAVLNEAFLNRARLAEADLYGAKLAGANLYGAVLTGANLGSATMTGAILYGAELTGANLYGATLTAADLGVATAEGANLGGAVLTGAKLYGARLTGAELRGAILTGADLRGAEVWGAAVDEPGALVDARDVKTDAQSPHVLRDLLRRVWAVSEGSPWGSTMPAMVDGNLAAAAQWQRRWKAMGKRDWHAKQREALTGLLVTVACKPYRSIHPAHALILRATLESQFGGSNGRMDPGAFARGVQACADEIGLGAEDRARLKRLRGLAGLGAP